MRTRFIDATEFVLGSAPSCSVNSIDLSFSCPLRIPVTFLSTRNNGLVVGTREEVTAVVLRVPELPVQLRLQLHSPLQQAFVEVNLIEVEQCLDQEGVVVCEGQDGSVT